MLATVCNVTLHYITLHDTQCPALLHEMLATDAEIRARGVAPALAGHAEVGASESARRSVGAVSERCRSGVVVVWARPRPPPQQAAGGGARRR